MTSTVHQSSPAVRPVHSSLIAMMGTLHSSRVPVPRPPKEIPTVVSDFTEVGVVDCGWKEPYIFVKTHVFRQITYDPKKHVKGINLLPNYAMAKPAPLYVPDGDTGTPVVPTPPSSPPSIPDVELKHSSSMRAYLKCLPTPVKAVYARYG